MTPPEKTMAKTAIAPATASSNETAERIRDFLRKKTVGLRVRFFFRVSLASSKE